MKKAFIIMSCCLALTSCGKDNGSGVTLPKGYQGTNAAYFYSLRDCVWFAEEELKKKNANDTNESTVKDGVVFMSGTLANSDSVLYICSAHPYPIATLIAGVKPALPGQPGPSQTAEPKAR